MGVVAPSRELGRIFSGQILTLYGPTALTGTPVAAVTTDWIYLGAWAGGTPKVNIGVLISGIAGGGSEDLDITMEQSYDKTNAPTATAAGANAAFTNIDADGTFTDVLNALYAPYARFILTFTDITAITPTLWVHVHPF